jgi:hypothetical protein
LTTTDWLVSLGLVALVLRQSRSRRMTVTGLLWPVGLVLWAADQYLRAIPDDSSDQRFVVVLGALGLALGVGCGVLTTVTVEGEQVLSRATATAAALWIAGVAARLVFAYYAEHGGASQIAAWTRRLDLHSADTWATALMAMALAEVLSRSAILLARYYRAAAGLATR